jgi:hypothetical protein
MQGHRGSFVGELTEKQYDIIDAAQKVASELNTDVAAVALAWVGAESTGRQLNRRWGQNHGSPRGEPEGPGAEGCQAIGSIY